MAVAHLLPLLLSLQGSQLVILSLKLLDPLVVIIYSSAKHLLCPLLANYELVQMLLEKGWCDPRGSSDAGAAQRSSSWLVRLVYASERLTSKVRALELARCSS